MKSGLTYATQQEIKLWVAKLRRSLLQEYERQRQGAGSAPETDARQCTYALLMRLVSLKCMEARGLLFIDGEATEAVTTRPEYGDRSRLLWQLRAAGRGYHGDEPRLWRDGLTCAFRALTDEMGSSGAHKDQPTRKVAQERAEGFGVRQSHAALTPSAPQGRTICASSPATEAELANGCQSGMGLPHSKASGSDLNDSEPIPHWPGHPILMETLHAINSAFPPEIYAAPDFLGWVYAFFYAEENRQLKTGGAGAPRTADELAALNRFYTPEWIVRFLIDNTLGRIWLRMHPDSHLGERLTYLAPGGGDAARLSLKPVREIRLLDPACGTMHFGVYACDLFYEMYQEEFARAGTPGWPTMASVASPADIPAAILAHNLHGIDIDPTALPVAALALRLALKEQARIRGSDPRAITLPAMNLCSGDALGAADRVEGDAHLRQLLRQRYDVIVMNPPFGAALPDTRAYLDATFPNWCGNLLCAFFAHTRLLCEPHGRIGMVFDFAVCLRAGYEDFRLGELLQEERLETLLHLGWDVLHANVEVGALVASASGGIPAPRFFDLTDTRAKEEVFRQALRGRHPDRCHTPSSAELRAGPWSAFAYRLPRPVLASMGRAEGEAPGTAPRHDRGVCALDHLAYCPSGGMDAPSSRYYRRAWEVPGSWVAPHGRYAPFWNGAEEPAAYYVTSDQIVRWDGEGRVIEKEPRAHMRLKRHYFQPCIVWGKRARTLRVASLDGHALSKEGQALFPHAPDDQWWLIAVLNSRLMRYVLAQYCGQHKYGSHVGRLPVIQPPPSVKAMLAAAAREIHDRKAAWDTGNEISSHFTTPWLLQQHERRREPPRLSQLLDDCLEWEQRESRACRHLQEQIDAAVEALYALSDTDRRRIEGAPGDREEEQVWPQMAGRDGAQKRREHLIRLLAYLVKRVMEAAEDGIVPLVRCGGQPSLRERVQEQLAAHFGAHHCPAIEAEIRDELGGRLDLAAWLARHYFRHHCALYKRRPIHWHITSPDGSFGALLHYHRLRRDTLTRLCEHYLGGEHGFMLQTQREWEWLQSGVSPSSRARIAHLRRDLAAACALDERLRRIQAGEYPTHIPWRSEADQPEGWDPDIDHGVKINLGPFAAAGVLAIKSLG